MNPNPSIFWSPSGSHPKHGLGVNVPKRNVTIDEISWQNPQAVGDTFTVVDLAGNVVKTATCSVPHQVVTFPMSATVPDFAVSQLSSGGLFVSWH
jgi:hypothetical protein